MTFFLSAWGVLDVRVPEVVLAGLLRRDFPPRLGGEGAGMLTRQTMNFAVL